jgi:hypothetical protein
MAMIGGISGKTQEHQSSRRTKTCVFAAVDQTGTPEMHSKHQGLASYDQ